MESTPILKTKAASATQAHYNSRTQSQINENDIGSLERNGIKAMNVV